MLTLYKHQEQALARLRIHDSYMLAMDQGTGKTLPMLWHIRDLLRKRNARSCLIVCPKAVVGSWFRDMAKFDEASQALFKEYVTVTTYDMVWRRASINGAQWDCIVLDEAHKIKNRTSRRAACLLRMALDAKYRYELTGTPISNGQLENLWSLMTFLYPVKRHQYVHSKIFGSYYDWQKKYALLDQWHKPYAYRHVPELQDILRTHSYRVLKSECLDLPEKLPDEIYDIELKEKQRYKQLMKDSALEEFDLIADNGLARMTKLRTLCSGFLNTEEGLVGLNCEKPQAFADFLEDYGEGKLVVFCQFKWSIQAVCGILSEQHIKYRVIDGNTKDKSCWREFQEDESIKVIVCQYESANAGIDLYAADTMLFYEPCLSANVMEQSRDRIHRIGQHHPCRYVYFITLGTIEHDIYQALINYSDFGTKLFRQSIESYRKGCRV